MQHYRRLKGILVALLVSTILSNLLLWLGAISKLNLLPWIGIEAEKMFRMVPFTPAINLIGGVIFGFGMILAGGCIAGTLFRIGEGYVASIMTFIGVLVGPLGLAAAVLVGFAGTQIQHVGEMLESLGFALDAHGLANVLIPNIPEMLAESPSGQTLPEMLAMNPMLAALLFSGLYVGLYLLLRRLGSQK